MHSYTTSSYQSPRPEGIHVGTSERMGSKQAKFDEESMTEFEATTSLNRYEIYHAFKQFHQLYREYQLSSDDPVPDMVNPFRMRICTIFAAVGNGMMSFIEFLDMVSAFSPKNDLQQKSHHAFQIFDIDGDGIISRKDVYEVLDMLTDTNMNDEKKDQIVNGIFSEVNKEPSCDGLSTEDFQYAISRSPDFASTFSFRV